MAKKVIKPSIEQLREYKESNSINEVLVWAVNEVSSIEEQKTKVKAPRIPEIGEVREFIVESLTFLSGEIRKPDFIKLASSSDYARLQVAAETYRLIQKKSSKEIDSIVIDFEDVNLIDQELESEVASLMQEQAQLNIKAREAEVVTSVRNALRVNLEKEKGEKIKAATLRKTAKEEDLIAFKDILSEAGVVFEARKNRPNEIMRAMEGFSTEDLYKIVVPYCPSSREEAPTSRLFASIGSMKAGNYIGLNSFTGAELIFISAMSRNEAESIEIASRANESIAVSGEVRELMADLYCDVQKGEVHIPLVEDISYAINIGTMLPAWDEDLSQYILGSLQRVLYAERAEYSTESLKSHLGLAAYIADEFWDGVLDEKDGAQKIYKYLQELYGRTPEEGPNSLPEFDKIFNDPMDFNSKATAIILSFLRYKDFTPEERQRLVSSTYQIFAENGNNDRLRHSVLYEDGIKSAMQIKDSSSEGDPLLAVKSMVAKLIGGNIITLGRNPYIPNKENLGDISIGDLVLSWLESDIGKKFNKAYPLEIIKLESEYDQLVAKIFIDLNSFTQIESVRIDVDAFRDLEELRRQIVEGNIPMLLREQYSKKQMDDHTKYFLEKMSDGKIPLTIIDVVDIGELMSEEYLELCKYVYEIENTWLADFTASLPQKYKKYGEQFLQNKLPSREQFLNSHSYFTQGDLDDLLQRITDNTDLNLMDLSDEIKESLMISYGLLARANVYGGHIGSVLPDEEHYRVLSGVLDNPYVQVSSWSLSNIRKIAEEVLSGREDVESTAEFVYKRLVYMQILMAKNPKNTYHDASVAVKYFMLGDHQASFKLQQALFNEALEGSTHGKAFEAHEKTSDLRTVMDEAKRLAKMKEDLLPEGLSQELLGFQSYEGSINAAKIVTEQALNGEDSLRIPDDMEETIRWEFRRIFSGFSNKTIGLLAKSLVSLPITQRLNRTVEVNNEKIESLGVVSVCASSVDRTWGAFTSLTEQNIQISAVQKKLIEHENGTWKIKDRHNLLAIANRIIQSIENLPGFVERMDEHTGENVFIQPQIDALLRIGNAAALSESAISVQKEILKGNLRSILSKERSGEDTQYLYSLWIDLLRELPETIVEDLRRVTNIEELEEVILQDVIGAAERIEEEATLAEERLLTHPLVMSLQENEDRFGPELHVNLFSTLIIGGHEPVNWLQGEAAEVEENKRRPLIELLLPGVRIYLEDGSLDIKAIEEAMDTLDELLVVSKDAIETLDVNQPVKEKEIIVVPNDSQKSKLSAKDRRRRDRERDTVGIKRRSQQGVTAEELGGL